MLHSGLTDDVPQGGLIISLPQRWSYSKPATAVVLWQSCRKVVLQTPCRFAAVHGGVIMLRKGVARRKTVRQSVRPDIFYAPRLLLTQDAAEEASVTTSRSSSLGSHDATQGCCRRKTVRQIVGRDRFHVLRLLLTQGASEEASVTASRRSILGSHDATQGCCEKKDSETDCQT